MEFVVNEWLMEYLRPNASHAEKALAQQFLQRFMQREFNSDTYLFEAATFTKDKIIVTTDEKLAY